MKFRVVVPVAVEITIDKAEYPTWDKAAHAALVRGIEMFQNQAQRDTWLQWDMERAKVDRQGSTRQPYSSNKGYSPNPTAEPANTAIHAVTEELSWPGLFRLVERNEIMKG